MDGIINYLLKNSNESKFLLDSYIFKIIPMMNIDGVTLGNFRCSLAGADLNRKWNRPNKVFINIATFLHNLTLL